MALPEGYQPFNPNASAPSSLPDGYEPYDPNGSTKAPAYQGTALENTAEALRGVGKAVAPYAQQVLSQPDVQPFNGANPFSKPQGGPLEQVLGSMRQIASLPTRFSATLGQASQPVADMTAEGLGKAGVNPYLSAGIATATGIAADPRSWVPANGMSIEHPNELPSDVAEAREARTGVPARDFQRLYKDPGAIFAGNNVKEAGAKIGKAKAAAGINPGVTDDLASLTPENIARIDPTKAINMDSINTVLGKLTNGETPTAQEAQNGLNAVNDILSQPSVRNNDNVFRQWTVIKSHINNSLDKVAPDVHAANQNFAREKLGETFASMEAVNKNGKPSKLAMMAKQVPAAVGGAIGGLLGGTGGAAAGYTVGKEAAGLYHAPFIAGLQTAAGAAVSKPTNALLEYLEKAGTSPQVQAYVARYLEQAKNQNK